MSEKTFHLAAAPCNYGVFELSEGGEIDGETLLAEVADTGYEGIDLGPVGFLGDQRTLADNLLRHGLSLAGGWIQMDFSTGDDSKRLTEIERFLDLFDAASPAATLAPPPRPHLAAANIKPDNWGDFFGRIQKVCDAGRDHGYELAFHPHVNTPIEGPNEIDALFEATDIGLCLDPGHLLVGEADVEATVKRWGARIVQVHIKDVNKKIVKEVKDSGAEPMEVWRRRAFCPMGEGDVDLLGLLASLRTIGYSGWLVVEQDVLPSDGYLPIAIADQRKNFEWLQHALTGVASV